MVDVTGWSDLLQGNIFSAVFRMFDASMSGYGVFVLFCVFQAILVFKTRNFVLMWITGLIFAAMYTTAVYVDVLMNGPSIKLIFTMLALELGGIIYYVFWK